MHRQLKGKNTLQNKSSIHRKFFPQNFYLFRTNQFCGGIITAILGEIVLEVNNVGF